MIGKPLIATVAEVTALIAGVVLGGRWGICALLALVSIALALRGDRWFRTSSYDRSAGYLAIGGATVGVVALLAAMALSPAVIATLGLAVEWSTATAVRGSAHQWLIAALPIVALALASELVFRRWLLERVVTIVSATGEPRFLANAAGVVIAAICEAAIVSVGDAGGWGRIGAMLGSCGLGILYLSSANCLSASIAARIAFELGLLAAQGFQWIG